MPEYRIIGYEPTINDIMQDMGVNSEGQIRPTLLNKLRSLRDTARNRGDIKRFNDSPYEFILCESTEFYRTFVDAGHGSRAMTIIDEWGGETFFLLFRDKVPEEFYPIPVTHETEEYNEAQKGVPQDKAHENAARKEIEKAEKLGKREKYIAFLQERYPTELAELKRLGII